jgi:gliding-associated putative ABC transporter substrate-binding component GldG
MKRRSKHGAAAVTATVTLLGILLVVNLLSTQLFTRLDLTEGRVYTLAKASRDLVRNLEDKLVVKAYFSKELPAPYNSNARYLRDQLDDYKAYGGGKFSFEFVDPASDSLLEREAQMYQIQPVQVNAVEKDKIEVKRVCMGLVFLYEDKHETIPLVQSTAGLEYDISSTIKRLTSKNRVKVGFLQGQGAPDFYQEMNGLRQTLERNYDLRAVSLDRNQMVPDDLNILIIAGAKEDFDDWSKYAIDQFIMKGGKAAFLLNKVSADLQTSQANRAPLRIDDWTSNYGFKINDDLVMDRKCGMVNVRQQMGFFMISNAVQYPFFPQITNFNPSSPMVKDLENIMLFFPSTIDTTLAEDKGLELTPLLYTSKNSKVQRGRFDISPMQKVDAASMNEGPFVLGAALNGIFKSYFAGKPIPQGDTTASPSANLTIVDESPETRVVVIADGHIAQDAYMSDPSNITFLLNMVDWLALDEALMQIRTREVTNRPLADVSEGVKATVKYANIFIPAIIVIMIGVVRWQMRRRRKGLEF